MTRHVVLAGRVVEVTVTDLDIARARAELTPMAVEPVAITAYVIAVLDELAADIERWAAVCGARVAYAKAREAFAMQQAAAELLTAGAR